ncbi:MAG: hypothetical protein KF729_04970 [Sandaracinaceae bacterium]|nr:hypothetical protein [Sandaracinaceae bacterium]
MRAWVGTRKGTFVIEKVGGAWRPRLAGHAGMGVNYVAPDPGTGTLWAALGHGHWGAKLSRSDDGGASWRDASQIKYPQDARHLVPPPPSEDPEAASGPVVIQPATLLKLWVLAFGPGRIYVGTIPGGLFTSDDDGGHFALNRPLWSHESRGGDLFEGEGSGTTHWFGTPAAADTGEFAPGIHSIAVDPKDPQRVLVAISTAGVLETTDGGASWRSRNRGMLNDYLPDPAAEWGHDPHFVTLSANHPEHVWQQNHSGVFYSDDGAASWRKVSDPDRGVHFGFPIAADADDGRTAWVVPGKSDAARMTIDGALFVARTSDGGQSWEPLREGLPQANAYDVVYRHALDHQRGCLAFGSTTGNLYVSEDRGDRWACAATNLPPIYSVRWG